MFRAVVFLSVCFIYQSRCDEFYRPYSRVCDRISDPTDRPNAWWAEPDERISDCNVVSGVDECSICAYGTIDLDEEYNLCLILKLTWKYNFYLPEGAPDKPYQVCIMMDHCKMSYGIQFRDNRPTPDPDKGAYLINYICGTLNENGEREQRGDCKSGFGTFICECYKPYQGRNCMDLGPDGAYATGVQVLVDTRVRVSTYTTILIAVKTKGHHFKVNVHLLEVDGVITLTEPIIEDSTSTQIVKYCRANTYLHEQCDTYLEGSTSLYVVNVRFPLVRNKDVWFYKTVEDPKGYPVGYITRISVTAFNTINDEEKESFYRTNYDRNYNVFIQYPIDIGCYNDTKIVNCNEVREKVNIYDASQEIVVHGDSLQLEMYNKNTLSCSSVDDETTRWELSKMMPDGSYNEMAEVKEESKYKFVIKPYLFFNGNYLIEFTISRKNKWQVTENFDQCFFTVVEAPLVAIIEGGYSRYVNVETVITLDGSRSYDPNVESEISKEGLYFEWFCTINRTKDTCLKDYMSPKVGLTNNLKLPPSALELGEQYIITLKVSKKGKQPIYTSQTLITGERGGDVQSIDVSCLNCREGNIANPSDYIYLSAKVLLTPDAKIKPPLNITWTYSIHPIYPPDTSTEKIRVQQEWTSGQDVLKIDKNKLDPNNTYYFRATIPEMKLVYSEISIHTSFSKNFTCSITPDAGIVAETDFTLNCTAVSGLTYEVYDKSLGDPDYFSGRMLFTGFNPNDNRFKLASTKIVVYGYNKYKLIQEWSQEIKLTSSVRNLTDIVDMVRNLEYIEMYRQRLLHSTSVIPSALSSGQDWRSIDLLKDLISLVYQVDFEAMEDIKLVLSSLQFILLTMSHMESNKIFNLKIDEAKSCAEIISALANSLFERVKVFDSQPTLTELILDQMITSHLNVIEIVFTVQNDELFSKPLHLINPYILYVVGDITYALVDALYKMSASLLWRQIEGDPATEIVSLESKITGWAIVHNPEQLYSSISQNKSVPFNFSHSFYEKIKHLDVLGVQIMTLNVNPFWWAGGDINTDILLVDTCFKVNLTKCKSERTFFKSPVFLYFNISQAYASVEPLEIHTVYLDLTKDPSDLDLAITVYRFDPLLRAKLFIQFEFENPTEDYKVLFSLNKRPDYDQMKRRGKTINNNNQSTVEYVKYIKDDSDKLYYLGIFPVQNGDAGKRVKVKLKILYAVCKTWLRWKWGGQRCWVGEHETNEETLRCDCSHLSMFAGSVQVPRYILNPGLEFVLFLTEEFNWIPLVVLIIVLLLFIILYIWGRLRDKKDSLKGTVIILEDNYPGESFGYLIGVYTGSRINSSTDANVGIKIFGEYDRSRPHILKSSDRVTLRGNSDDWFLLYSPVHLGTLESIHIWHDNSGKSPDWFIERIEVYDLHNKFEYIFEINIWLALGVNEYPDAVVAPSSIEDFYSVKRVFLSNVITGFRDTNYWTSIFWKHPRNPVTRVLRISVVLCFIMVAIMCSVLLYHFNTGEDYEEDEPSYNLTCTDLIIFIITLCVASFSACLVMLLFRKSFSLRYVRMQSSLFIRPTVTSKRSATFNPSNENVLVSENDKSKSMGRLSVVSLYDSAKPQFIELSSTDLNEKSISLGLRGKRARERNTFENFAAAIHAIVRGSTLEPVRLPKYKSNVILHKTYFIIAWILFVVLILATLATVILFGHRLPNVVSKKWVTVFLCVLLFDALILSTLKILLCSIILGCAFQRLVPASNYQLKPEDGMRRNLAGDLDYLYKLLELRSRQMYCPLNEKLKEFYRQKCMRREQWKSLIDFLVVLLLIFVLVMLFSLFTLALYSTNAHAAWMLTKGPSLNYHMFTNIYNRTIFTDFILHNFIYQLHRYLWYTQVDPLQRKEAMTRKSWTYDCTMRLLGNARIRQLRVVLGGCRAVDYFEDYQEDCSPAWSPGVEDTGTYGSRWEVGGNEDLRRRSTAWRYTDPTKSNSSEFKGPSLTVYPAGGFIEDLGYEKDAAEGALSSLIPQNWLDHMTRALFIELTLYNVNTRLFTQVILLAEQTPTGEYLVAVNVESVTTDFIFNIWELSFGVFLIFFLLRMCILINRHGFFVYFSHIINVFEACLLALGFLALFFYLVHISSSSGYVQDFHRSGLDAFFNFHNLISYIIWSRTVFCILFVCVFVRMLISMRFGRICFTFYYTFLLSIPCILWLVFVFVVYLVIVKRFVGYLLNTFLSPYATTVLIYHMDPIVSGCEDMHCKVLVYSMSIMCYAVILLFFASFVYYYKVAKVYRLIDTDRFNFYTFVKEAINRRFKNKQN